MVADHQGSGHKGGMNQCEFCPAQVCFKGSCASSGSAQVTEAREIGYPQSEAEASLRARALLAIAVGVNVAVLDDIVRMLQGRNSDDRFPLKTRRP